MRSDKEKNGKIITAKIYALYHNNTPIYVGFTTGFLFTRLYRHYCSAQYSQDTHLKKYLVDHHDVTIELLDEVSYAFDYDRWHSEALRLERYWMDQFKAWGYNIFNKEIHGLLKPSDEIKERKTTVLAANIKLMRKFMGLTQRALSEKLDIKRSLLGAYEEARAEPPMPLLLKMCQLFGIRDIKTFISAAVEIDAKKAA